MSNKQQLVNNIREWVKLDNEIRSLKKEQEQRKKKQKSLNETLI